MVKLGEKTIGVLVGGGDCPGINNVLAALVRIAEANDMRVLAFQGGWQGVFTQVPRYLTGADQFSAAEHGEISAANILNLSGSIIETGRYNPFNDNKLETDFRSPLACCDVLIAIGGDDTQYVTKRLARAGFPVIAIPKTQDNDLDGTDFCVGFDSVVNSCVAMGDGLRSSALAHRRVLILEVCGRNAGFVALETAIGLQAEFCAIPEYPVNSSQILETLRGKKSGIIVISEAAQFTDFAADAIQVQADAKDGFVNLQQREREIGKWLAGKLQQHGFSAYAEVPTHIVRMGSASAFDRQLAWHFSQMAISCIIEGIYGVMTCYSGGVYSVKQLDHVMTANKKVSSVDYHSAFPHTSDTKRGG